MSSSSQLQSVPTLTPIAIDVAFGDAAVDFTEYFFSSWYPLVQDYTFPTVTLPLTLHEAEAMIAFRSEARIAHYLASHSPRSHEDALQSTEDVDIAARRAESMRLVFSSFSLVEYPAVSLPPEVTRVLDGIREKIETGMIHLLGSNDSERGIFVKLSCRSPKDAVLLLPQFEQVFTQEARRSPIESQHPSTDMALAFCRATFSALRITSAQSGLSLLLASQRIADDLDLSVQRLREDPTKQWQMDILLRKWQDIDTLGEIRVFVSNGVITAMSQYHEFNYIPQFSDPIFRKKMEAGIRSIFNVIYKNLPFTSAIIDFAPDAADVDKIWIIEINPPPPIGGTPLFNWGNPNDRAILLQGPFEFRYVEKPLPRDDCSLPPKYVTMYNDIRSRQTPLLKDCHIS